MEDIIRKVLDQRGIEFPDRLLRKTSFQSIRSIHDALSEVGVAEA